MKSKLQYAYSISVFFGVLLSSYLMMSKEGTGMEPVRTMQSPTFRTEAMPLDPAVNQLFEMEDAITKLGKARLEDRKRAPSDIEIKASIPKP